MVQCGGLEQDISEPIPANPAVSSPAGTKDRSKQRFPDKGKIGENENEEREKCTIKLTTQEEEFLSRGFNGFLKKPFSTNTLSDKIAELLM